MILIRKARLKDAPFTGTVLDIDTRLGTVPEFGLYAAVLSEGATSVHVAWGDGSTQEATAEDFPLTHVYAKDGTYAIRLSDDITALGVATTGTTDATARFKLYHPALTGFATNATKLSRLLGYSFITNVNLTHLDLTAARIEAIEKAAFKSCTALPEVLKLPSVRTLDGMGLTLPFRGCSSLRLIRFAAANRGAVEAAPAYLKDFRLGAPNATVVFDL